MVLVASYILNENSLILVVEHNGIAEPVIFDDLWILHKHELINEDEIQDIDYAFDTLITAIFRKFSKYYKARSYLTSLDFINKKGRFTIDLKAKSVYFPELQERAKKEMIDLILKCIPEHILIKEDSNEVVK